MSMRLTVGALASVVLFGCSSTRTTYESAVVPREHWRAPVEQTADASPWWHRFENPALEAAIADALALDNSLAAATLRVRQAQFTARLVDNDRYPQLNAGVDASASRAFKGPPTARSFGASIGVSYEVDLWRRFDALADAAAWEVAATQEDRRTAALALIATTAVLYFRLGYLDERLALDDASLAVAVRTLELIEVQYAAGSASSLELAEARRSLLVLEAARSDRQQARTVARNGLGVLLGGRDTTSYSVEPIGQLNIPSVDAGVPARLLARRPDLRAAEARLRSLFANADAAKVEFYPTLSLTADAGTASTQLRDIVSNPIGTLAAAVTLPFLNIDRARLTRDIARVSYESAVLEFKDKLLRSLSEVENALSARQQLQEQARLVTRALNEALTAERIYELRYRAGSVALRDWLAAQDARRVLEANLLDNKLAQLTNHVELSQALGDGFDDSTVGGSPP